MFWDMTSYGILTGWNSTGSYGVTSQKTEFYYVSKTKKLNSVAFSPHENYTDRATAACRRS
jgi:hypothetical protein